MDITEASLPTELADRLRHAPRTRDPRTSGVVWDFASFDPGPHAGREDGYGFCDAADDCAACAAPLTPLLAELLVIGVGAVRDTLETEVEWCDLADVDEALVGLLPPPVLRYLQRIGEEQAGWWLGRFIATVRVVGARVLVGEVPYPRNTAEEMALHLCIRAAEDWCSDEVVDHEPLLTALGPQELLTTHARDLGRLYDVLFEDHDVLWLFEPLLDGVEDDSGELAQYLGTVNLHPRSWFAPFRSDVPVPAFGPPDPTGPLLVELGEDPVEAEVFDAAQRWLDCVVGAGTATYAEGVAGSFWCVEVDGLPLDVSFQLDVVHAGNGTWEVSGVLWMPVDENESRGRSVFSRGPIDRHWIPE